MIHAIYTAKLRSNQIKVACFDAHWSAYKEEIPLETTTLSTPQSGSIAKNRRALNVWVDAGTSSATLLRQLNQSARFEFKQAEKKSTADLQLVEWCNFYPENTHSPQTQAELLSAVQELPTLVVADESSDLFSVLEASSSLDHSRLELVNTYELGSALFDARIARFLKAERHLSTQKLLNDNSQTMLETVMRHSNDWIVIKSLDHRFLQVSKKFCHAFGKTSDEVIGKNDLEIGTSPELVLGKTGTDWKGYWALDKEVTDAGEHVVLQPVVLEEDEHQKMRESTDKIPLRDRNGNVFALFVCVAELIQRKMSDHATKEVSSEDYEAERFWETKQNLEHSPALLALNDERKRAEALHHESERAFMAKNQFIAAASHDLRQPLHALGLYLGALDGKVTEDGRHLVDKLEHCVSSLSELLNSLLDISRLDANVVSAELSSFSVDDLLQPLLDECQSIATGKSLQFFSRTDASFVYSDPVLLQRIIRNLLMNAFNHTEEGKVSLTARKLGNHINIEISDTGIGIPPDKQELVFEEFAKLDSHSQHDQKGLGLGLSIVKRLSLLLGAKTELQSTVGKGTIVSVIVPMGLSTPIESSNQQSSNLNHPEESQHPFSTDPSTSRKLILVVDDAREVCAAVDAILSTSGYRTITATNPQQALEALYASSLIPDALLVDFRLSESMTGLDAIQIISEALGKAIPALIVTGDTTDDGLKEITGSGYQHLHKPVNADELLKYIRQTLQSVRT